jgi:uncharacterized SAM-binding protein YcdF (DUF218 family)
MKYDLIIVLASFPDPKSWKFPQQIYDCLDQAHVMLSTGQAPYIALSGKWSVSIDNKGLKQPFRECDAMADYLISIGAPASKLLKEGDSKDTISNLYYLKKQILLPKNMKKLVFVVAEFRIPRLKFLCDRILGDSYMIDFHSIACEVSSGYNEENTFKVQKDFLAPMKNGDHSWLDGKFYSASLYQYWKIREARH